MNSEEKIFFTALKHLIVGIPLLVVAPILLTMGFKALENSYLLLVVGGILSILAIFLCFKGLRIIVISLFNSN